MNMYDTNSDSVYDIKYHIIWITKYRYHVLKRDVAERTREFIRQGCQARGITILQGSVGKDRVYILVSCLPSIAVSKLVQYLKGRSSRLLKEQFPELQKRYWGQRRTLL